MGASFHTQNENNNNTNLIWSINLISSCLSSTLNCCIGFLLDWDWPTNCVTFVRSNQIRLSHNKVCLLFACAPLYCCRLLWKIIYDKSIERVHIYEKSFLIDWEAFKLLIEAANSRVKRGKKDDINEKENDFGLFRIK